MLNSNVLALAAGLAATATAQFTTCEGPYFSFYNRAGPAMASARIDPALFPGQESPHLHAFDGGNAVGAEMSYASTQSSECTTARIKPDMSLYWRPTLFWNGNNTGFYKVPEHQLKIYYRFGDAGNMWYNASEFPENFQMMVGDPFKRADDGDQHIKWACHGDTMTQSVGFPKGFTSCKNGFAADLTFPSCWNGKDLDPKNPNAHMARTAYNSKQGIEACPEDFRAARFPEIQVEFWYDVSGFDDHYDADSVPWVLSNGDSTGYGFHADFQNGWTKGVLGKAMAENDYCNCGCGCGQAEMEKCFGKENVNQDNVDPFASCSATPEFSVEANKPLDKLPGCNPVQAGPERATQATGPDCAAAAATGASSSAAGSIKTSSAQPTPSEAVASEAAGSSTTPEAATTPKATDSDQSASSAVASDMDATPTDKPKPSQTSYGKGDMPKLSKSVHGNKGVQHSSTQVSDVDAVAASSTADGYAALPSMSLAAPDDADASTTSSAGDEECKPPVTVTMTPTVYVTAGAVGADATSCDIPGTVTVTNTARTTVTVTAGSHYAQHKRHAHGHRF